MSTILAKQLPTTPTTTTDNQTIQPNAWFGVNSRTSWADMVEEDEEEERQAKTEKDTELKTDVEDATPCSVVNVEAETMLDQQQDLSPTEEKFLSFQEGPEISTTKIPLTGDDEKDINGYTCHLRSQSAPAGIRVKLPPVPEITLDNLVDQMSKAGIDIPSPIATPETSNIATPPSEADIDIPSPIVAPDTTVNILAETRSVANTAIASPVVIPDGILQDPHKNKEEDAYLTRLLALTKELQDQGDAEEEAAGWQTVVRKHRRRRVVPEVKVEVVGSAPVTPESGNKNKKKRRRNKEKRAAGQEPEQSQQGEEGQLPESKVQDELDTLSDPLVANGFQEVEREERVGRSSYFWVAILILGLLLIWECGIRFLW